MYLNSNCLCHLIMYGDTVRVTLRQICVIELFLMLTYYYKICTGKLSQRRKPSKCPLIYHLPLYQAFFHRFLLNSRNYLKSRGVLPKNRIFLLNSSEIPNFLHQNERFFRWTQGFISLTRGFVNSVVLEAAKSMKKAWYSTWGCHFVFSGHSLDPDVFGTKLRWG